ncbi:hypothetical protein [Nocardia sp. NPDC057668]|uniref:hypothetical protein n=1 Tax=Nocardia sp. NPDC057668 TaxID=3346202 RepID=UPI003671D46F
MDSVPSHPAVAAALAVLATLADDFRPLALVERGDAAVAILLESRDFRVVVIVEHRPAGWTAPAMITGTPRRPAPARQFRTLEHRPLLRMSRKRFTPTNGGGAPASTSWFAVLGNAAADAATLTLASSIDTHTTSVTASGLAFALVRTPTREQPRIHLRTLDGRLIPVEQ